jgi:hypothetical protein
MLPSRDEAAQPSTALREVYTASHDTVSSKSR